MTPSLPRSPVGSFHISVSCVCSAGWQKCLRLWGRPMGVLFTACENTRSPHLEPSGTSQTWDLPQSVYICTASVFSIGQEDKRRPYSCSPTFFGLCTPTALSASLKTDCTSALDLRCRFYAVGYASDFKLLFRGLHQRAITHADH